MNKYGITTAALGNAKANAAQVLRRIERIDSYKFDNPTPIKIHRQRSMWDKIKDKIES